MACLMREVVMVEVVKVREFRPRKFSDTSFPSPRYSLFLCWKNPQHPHVGIQIGLHLTLVSSFCISRVPTIHRVLRFLKDDHCEGYYSERV